MSSLGLLVLLTVLVVVVLVLWVASIVSIARSTYGWGIKLMCILACLALPVIGPVAWFAAGRRGQPARAQEVAGR